MGCDSGRESAASACSRHFPTHACGGRQAAVLPSVEESKEPDLLTGPSKLALALWLKFFARHGRFSEGRSEFVGSALSRSETTLTTKIASRIPAETIERMLTLIARRTAPLEDPGGKDTPEGAAAEAALTEAGGGQTADDADEAAQPEPAQEEEDEDELEGADIFAAIREEPGNVSVKSIEREAFKLGAIRAIDSHRPGPPGGAGAHAAGHLRLRHRRRHPLGRRRRAPLLRRRPALRPPQVLIGSRRL
jgi:hypothetical protein